MQVDFFDTSCLTVFSTSKVGISDANSDSNTPAVVKFEEEDTWDFTIHNPNRYEVEYRAIDYCIDVFRLVDNNTFSSASTGEELIKRCEGFLFRTEQFVVFFEIKTGLGKGWFTDACRKFEETILSFKEHHSDKSDLIRNPIISNKNYSTYRVPQNYGVQNDILRDKIGLNIEVKLSTSYDVA